MGIDLKISLEQLPEGRAVIVEVCQNNVVVRSFRARVGTTYGPDEKPGIILDNFDQRVETRPPPKVTSRNNLTIVK